MTTGKIHDPFGAAAELWEGNGPAWEDVPVADFTEEARNLIWTAAHTTPASDIRVFFHPPAPARPRISGIDALLTSPGILLEFFRRRALNRAGLPCGPDSPVSRDAYIRSLTPGELADIVWRQLFIDHSPVSEAARTVLTTLGLYGIDVGSGDLRILREQYEAIPEHERLARALGLANLDLVMYPVESMDGAAAASGNAVRPPFRPVMYLNDLLGDWKESARILRRQGFGLKAKVDEFTPIELRRHLAVEVARIAPVAVGLEWPAGHHPEDGGIGRLVREGVLPLCRERGLPFIVVAGGDPGPDGCPVTIDGLSPLWEDNPEIRFLLVPSRDDQLFPAMTAASRSRNLLLCGPDQPLDHPAALETFTIRRMEMSGTAFHACHSGAGTVEELVGRWAHLRWTLGKTLIRHYRELWRTGWPYGEADIKKDIAAILGGNVGTFMGLRTYG